MTSSQKSRHGCETARKWRQTAPLGPLSKRAGVAPQPWPLHAQPTGQTHRTHRPPPHLPFFHSRHAEESAERPHLVTIVRPDVQSPLRKVSVLLNRRGVVSFEQLLLDISEALGFPRWHRARVTRLFTTYAREVKSVCDFFRGDAAFLALGKARPELSSVQEALVELFPEHATYQADALQAWEKKLRSGPEKASKADSGYSEGTDSSGPQCDVHHDNSPKNHTSTRATNFADTHKPDNCDINTQKSHKKNKCRKPAHLPNHLQRLRPRGGIKEPQASVIGPFKHKEVRRDAIVPSPTLCENCLARRAKYQGPDRISLLSTRVPLPPVSRKQKDGSPTLQDLHSSPPPPQPTGDDENTPQKLQPLIPLLEMSHPSQSRTTFTLPSDDCEVTLSDIEELYEIGQVVGDGNFAIVRECWRRDDRQPLAVKVVERAKLIGREHMMQNELSLLGSLCHPRIVRLFAHHHTRSHSYLVMELLTGGDLFEAINERGKFDESEAGLMVSDVSEALNYIHCRSIVHRDIKPENLLMEHVSGGVSRLKLGDFGLAMVVTEPVFTICGTPTYVAPEILAETGYGVEVDVWALGIILYVLLCGFPPFRSRDRDQEELFEIIKQGQLTFLPPYWDSISEEAKDLIRALLQTDPTVRITAQQLLLHPWVKTMASVCRQRAVTDKPVNSDKTGTPTRRQRAAEDKRPGHAGSSGVLTELSRHDEGPTGRCDADRVETVDPLPAEAIPGHRKPMCVTRQPSGPVIQNLDTNLSNPDSPASQLSAPVAQTGPLSSVITHHREQITPEHLSPPSNLKPQTTLGQLSFGAAAASTDSLGKQNISSPQSVVQKAANPEQDDTMMKPPSAPTKTQSPV